MCMPGISFPDVRCMSGGCRGIRSGVRGEMYIMAAGRGSHAQFVRAGRQQAGRGGLSCEACLSQPSHDNTSLREKE